MIPMEKPRSGEGNTMVAEAAGILVINESSRELI